MTVSVRVAVLGASGYAGGELVRLLVRHPRVELVAVAGSSRAGEPMAAVFPHLRGIVELDLAEAASPALWDDLELDFVFLALPSGQAAELLPRVLPRAWERGVRVIDLSGDLRLPASLYEPWYGRPAADPALQAEAVYGLSELFPGRIREARLVANPGCYPTAILLALAPLAAAGGLASGQVVVDAKSGVSGAGRGASASTAFAEVNENFYPYKVGRHQHTPEIEHVLAELAGQGVTVLLTTHLLPVTRGILATCYVRPPEGWWPAPPVGEVAAAKAVIGGVGGPAAHPAGLAAQGAGAAAAAGAGRTAMQGAGEAGAPQQPDGAGDLGVVLDGLYRSFYAGKPFVRVLPPGQVPAIKHVQGSNFCDIGLHYDRRSGWITVFAAIDNLVKGAAGQAVQNLNLMAGWDETAGLDLVPLFP
ncbi:N-acetyl-gamma-glutamyl-phosphate reductase [Thermaerobacter marianensis DSM 12885]|uniref:N-acetyl-gamma-glutamyl-phosphate reductase n=1 Tax=Thermaerobacter marianensis (strain ATCC 700841 / DSM 12885 / JCM 10246 / 7p75a) TaxID=644966 RepID=E6SH24_THEM7|nr:N-acetyl-gamma-glutamyl-phosphate reductase [Thermaerobacter marianensis]ADU50655.1 N-acetyl-gamma-glutamyl-phosphate reductase [Thermaerobacter marianensis DSM 12885]